MIEMQFTELHGGILSLCNCMTYDWAHTCGSREMKY